MLFINKYILFKNTFIDKIEFIENNKNMDTDKEKYINENILENIYTNMENNNKEFNNKLNDFFIIEDIYDFLYNGVSNDTYESFMNNLNKLNSIVKKGVNIHIENYLLYIHTFLDIEHINEIIITKK